jgi:hypothetical protein
LLDLLFARPDLVDFGNDTRDEVRDSMEGVVGADRPSMYETWYVESRVVLWSGRGSLGVNGARER